MVEYLEHKNLKILGRRLKIFGVEIDVIARNSCGVLVLVEVKSLQRGEWLENRLSLRQLQRLRRVAQALAEGVPWLGSQGPREVELWLALVGETKASVQVFFDL